MNRQRRRVLGQAVVGAGSLLLATRSFGFADPKPGALTAAQVIERIKAHVGIPWLDKTVDRVVAGNAEAIVRGVAVAMMATFAVLEQAVAAGCNLIITHEPTFYSHEDDTASLRADPTYVAKSRYIAQHDLVIFRFHDHWHSMHPDGIDIGMLRQLGWQRNLSGEALWRFAFPQTPLDRFVATMARALGAHSMRVLGDPQFAVREVAANWGYADLKSDFRRAIDDPQIDLIIVGEAREWEVVEFVQDQITAGEHKALIVVGHVASEQAGMKYCAEWLTSIISEVPVRFVATAEPFWNENWVRPASMITH